MDYNYQRECSSAAQFILQPIILAEWISLNRYGAFHLWSLVSKRLEGLFWNPSHLKRLCAILKLAVIEL